jgi:hypothetical protein
MALNVLGKRRFASPNKQTVGLQGWQNVGEAGVGVSEATDLASRTLAAFWRRTLTVLLRLQKNLFFDSFSSFTD